MAKTVRLTVNGKRHTFSPRRTRSFSMSCATSSTCTDRFGCGLSQCGACTVHVDGEAALVHRRGVRSREKK